MDLIDHERVVLHHFLAHHEQIADIMDRVRVSMFTTDIHARLFINSSNSETGVIIGKMLSKAR